VITREHLNQAWVAWRAWPVRKHLTAGVAAVLTVLVVAVPTAMIPTPVFGREVAVTVWAWPVLLVTSALSGVVFATYLRTDREEKTDTQGKAGLVGAFLTYLAVGCPVCNKIALLALGYAGALQWFAPVQPWLGAGGVVLLVWAAIRRLAGEVACTVPARG
jgi:hypothetical protein